MRSQTSDHTRDFKENLNTFNLNTLSIVLGLVTLSYQGHFRLVQVTESSSPESEYYCCGGSSLCCYVLSSPSMSECQALDDG